jgi:hypothetical protein
MSTSETQSNLTAKLGPVLFLLAVLLAPLISQDVSNPVQLSFMVVSKKRKLSMSSAATQSNLTAKLGPVVFLLAPCNSTNHAAAIRLPLMLVSD